jgi:hypothetical protein
MSKEQNGTGTEGDGTPRWGTRYHKLIARNTEIQLIIALQRKSYLCIPFLGIFVSNFRHWFFAVWGQNQKKGSKKDK